MTTQTTTFIVEYPFGTSNAYKFFLKAEAAKKFIDEESNHTFLLLLDKQITMYEVEGDLESVETIFSSQDEQEKKYELLNNPIRTETVEHFRLESDVLIAKDKMGYLTRIETKDEAEEGDVIIEGYSDDVELYETLEEATAANAPSQFMTEF